MTDTAASAAPARVSGNRLSFWRLSAFALPAAPIMAIDTPISVYLPAFYAGAGLSLALVGALVFIGRIAEIPIALVAGGVSDRFGQARHRRKFWLVATTPAAMLALWLLFAPPTGPSGAYMLTWLLAVVVALTLLSINHAAWAAEVASGYRQRTRLQASRQVAAVAGLVAVLIPPILIERAHPANADQLRMQAIAGFIILLLPLSVAAALLAPEAPTPRPPVQRARWGEALAALRANRALRRLLLIDLCDAAALGVVTSLFVFLSRDIWGLGGLSSLLLLTYVISGVVFLGPILRAAGARSKPRTLAWIALGLAAALPTLLLAPPHGAALAFGCVLLLGAPSATNSALLDSLMGDIAAEDATTNGAVRTGLFYALHLIMGRVGRGVAIAAAYAVLDRIGFHPQAANAPAALTGFKLIYIAVPALFQLAIAALAWTFPEGPARRA